MSFFTENNDSDNDRRTAGPHGEPQPPQPWLLLRIYDWYPYVTEEQLIEKVGDAVLAVCALGDRLAVGGEVALRELCLVQKHLKAVRVCYRFYDVVGQVFDFGVHILVVLLDLH